MAAQYTGPGIAPLVYMMITRKQNLLVVSLLLISTWLMADQSTRLEVIPLHYRTAEEIIPLIRPFLSEDAHVSGSGFQLILRTNEQNLEEIKAILARLDHKPERLLIEVRQYQASDRSAEGSGLGVKVSPDDTRVQARIYTNENSSTGYGTYSVQALEGRMAHISVGQLIPYGSRVYIRTGQGIQVQDQVDFIDTSQGFDVMARMAGHDEVVMEIHPYNSRPSPRGGGIIDTSSAYTTLRARLDTWTNLGAVQEQVYQQGNERIYETRNRNQQLQLQIRVSKQP